MKKKQKSKISIDPKKGMKIIPVAGHRQARPIPLSEGKIKYNTSKRNSMKRYKNRLEELERSRSQISMPGTRAKRLGRLSHFDHLVIGAGSVVNLMGSYYEVVLSDDVHRHLNRSFARVRSRFNKAILGVTCEK